MRLSTVILPVRRRHEQRREVRREAEELGFHAACTYDHLSWRVPFRDGPWFGAVPTLTAAAAVTASGWEPRDVSQAPFTHRVLTWAHLVDATRYCT